MDGTELEEKNPVGPVFERSSPGSERWDRKEELKDEGTPMYSPRRLLPPLEMGQSGTESAVAKSSVKKLFSSPPSCE